MYVYLINTPHYTIKYYTEKKDKDIKEIEETYFKVVNKSIEIYKRIYNTNKELKITGKYIHYYEQNELNFNALLVFNNLNGARITKFVFSAINYYENDKSIITDEQLDKIIEEVSYLIKTLEKKRKKLKSKIRNIIVKYECIGSPNTINKEIQVLPYLMNEIIKDVTDIRIPSKELDDIIDELFNEVKLKLM